MATATGGFPSSLACATGAGSARCAQAAPASVAAASAMATACALDLLFIARLLACVNADPPARHAHERGARPVDAGKPASCGYHGDSCKRHTSAKSLRVRAVTDTSPPWRVYG